MAGAKKPRTARKKAKRKNPLQGGSRVPIDRLRLVETMMSSCFSRRDVVLEVVKQFAVTEKTAYGYYDKVEHEWQDEAKPRRRYRRALAIKRLENAYKLAMKVKAPSAAVRAIDSIARIDNLYEPDEVIVHTETVHPTESMTSAQRRAYIEAARHRREELLAKVVRAEPPPKHIVN